MLNRFALGLIAAFVILTATAGTTWRMYTAHQAVNEEVSRMRRKDITITIVEGKRREEIAKQLAQAGVTPYDAFMTASTSVEGRLFPDTYRFFPDTPAEEVVETLTKTFTTKAGDLKPTSQNLALASIIEREALNDTERALIAGVYANRLRLGMNLEADPTVQYGKDTITALGMRAPETYAFWGPITRADYHSVQSPFNTYLNSGLPPAPICNPGRKSIEASLSPAQHDYLFFAHRNGELMLSKTLTEHETKIRNSVRR